MKKVIGYLPLDDRPCNYCWAQKFLRNTSFKLLMPPRDIMGRFKIPAEREKIYLWLKNNVTSMDAIIMSMDLIAYGGLVASRRLDESLAEVRERIKFIEELKMLKPDLTVYAFSILMRISITVDSPESQKYWKHIFEYSKLYYQIEYLKQLELKDRIKEIESEIPQDLLQTYLDTRKRNFTLNKEYLGFLEKNQIDFLVYAQEDAAEYGFHREEQAALRKLIRKKELLEKVELITGTDEIGTLLLARYINVVSGYTPRIFVDYTFDKGKFFIAPYEDCCLNISIEEHIRLLGGIQGAEADNADIILLCHNSEQKAMDLFTSYPVVFDDTAAKVFLKKFKKYLKIKKIIAVADVFYTNGGDPALIELLSSKKYLKFISSYTGLNTTSNSIGLTLGQASLILTLKHDRKHIEELLLERILDDCYYQTLIRPEISKKIISHGLSPLNLLEKSREYEEEIENKLMEYLEKLCLYEKTSLKHFSAILPWNRTFEVEIDMNIDSE
ncbi:MAG TPA: DUF4127 family protein [Candidatus Eremiobacteraeota bacterium]|nr:MAG: hypothetical protein BWY64_01037 [bacterium ADurb.Bin363]HPZ09051.1 DUF4127 family protein [Candidatus Eremiobacteraeota bacterium]